MHWRLNSLRACHEALDHELRAEEVRPAADDYKVRALKRAKLAARDEIARLLQTGPLIQA